MLTHPQKKWGFILVNKKKYIQSCWNTVEIFFIYVCPDIVLFFSCYPPWSFLDLWNRNGTASFLHTREGVTHGGVLAMVAYGIGVLPLIK